MYKLFLADITYNIYTYNYIVVYDYVLNGGGEYESLMDIDQQQ